MDVDIITDFEYINFEKNVKMYEGKIYNFYCF